MEITPRTILLEVTSTLGYPEDTDEFIGFASVVEINMGEPKTAKRGIKIVGLDGMFNLMFDGDNYALDYESPDGKNDFKEQNKTLQPLLLQFLESQRK